MVCCQLSVAGCSLLVVRWSAAQIPNTKLQRNPKLQTPNGASLPPYWSLEFGASLEFGFGAFVRTAAPPRLRCSAFDVGCSMFVLFVTQGLHWIDLRRATTGSLRQRRRDSPDPTIPVVRAAGPFAARIGQRNCIDARML